ncbi:hypothetical protein A9Q99_08125 [Gammaproteobacteria bacterium 45_16_T64]|nr:hypothetical protein A9Q99_08125 [Gammaproteobacteria bacterium 45_16_T64]
MDLEKFDTEELIALAKFDLEHDKIDFALEKIKSALEKDDCPLEARGIAARLYAQIKLFDKAAMLYKEFLVASPESNTERFQLGMVNLESGNKEEAISIWSNLLEQEPTHPPSLYYSAVALIELERQDDAIRHLNVLLQSAPADNLYFGKAKEILDKMKTSISVQENTPSSLYQ